MPADQSAGGLDELTRPDADAGLMTLKRACSPSTYGALMPSRVDLPLIRKRDRKPVGTLTIVRANHWGFGDDVRHRTGSPKRIDQLLITLTDANGENVAYLEVPMDQLPPDG